MISQTGHNLIFVLSLPRSGSTLVSAILGNHSKVTSPPEPWLLLRLHEVYGSARSDRIYNDSLAGSAIRGFLNRDEFVAGTRAFASQAYNSALLRSGASVLVDKTPQYFHILDFIEELFPDARKIWLKRNPLDTAASLKSTWGLDPDSLCGDKLGPHCFDFIIGIPNLSAYFARKSPLKHELRYEDLVRRPEEEVRKLAAFCGLDFEASMLDLNADSKSVRLLKTSDFGDWKFRSLTGITAASVDEWKKRIQPEEVASFAARLGSRIFMDAGYPELADAHPEWFSHGSDNAALSEQKERLLSRFREQTDVQVLREKLAALEAENAAVTAAASADVHALKQQLTESGDARSALLKDIQILTAERDARNVLIRRIRRSYIFRALRKLGLWGWLEQC